jgi:hypothetical protein
MDERVLRFAELLFRGDVAKIALAREALAQPAAFIAQHASDLGYIRPKPGWAPSPWQLLLDIAEVNGWVRVVDWRADAEEVVASVRALVPGRDFSVDWEELVESHGKEETRGFLRAVAQAMPAGERLVCLDNGSDSYPLALLPTASLAQAQQSALEIGGRVESLEEEGE